MAEHSGRFSIRSAYRLLVEMKRQRKDWLEHRLGPSDLEATRRQWSNLWGVKVPSKVIFFAWRLAHVSLLTGDVRLSRNMAQAATCSVCNATEDSWHQWRSLG